MARRMRRRVGLLFVVAVLPLALWAALPLISGAESPGSIQNKIQTKQNQIEQHKGRERVLTSDISAATHRISSLQGDISELQGKQVSLESDLQAKRAELARIQADLRRERLKLARLRDRLARARVLLAQRLVESYKDDAPDIVTVVLEADGMADLLERAQFMQQMSENDANLIERVTSAKAEATATAQHLDQLEQKAQEVAKQIEGQVAEVVAVKGNLIDRRNSFQSARADKASMLASTRDSRHALEEDVASLQKEQSAILARLQGSAGAAPVQHGSGGMVWPVSGPITSGFCEVRSYEACHPGIDIAVPTGTPIRAAASGKVVIAGWVSGYGNYTCIQHSGSLSTCYGHQERFATSVGASVGQGQVIGYSDCTGRCFGPHLHFEVRINGQVVNPMNYL
jgi:peptidoglycan DL-endopeptidase CwlO